jgi:hypothetical protein
VPLAQARPAGVLGGPALHCHHCAHGVAEDYELSSPQRYPMADADVAALAGVPVSRDRGEGYQPWPRLPEPDWRVAWTILLPRPRGMKRGCFTTAPSWCRRLARQVIPRRAPRDCCYYHSVPSRRRDAGGLQADLGGVAEALGEPHVLAAGAVRGRGSVGELAGVDGYGVSVRLLS